MHIHKITYATTITINNQQIKNKIKKQIFEIHILISNESRTSMR